MRRHPPHHLSPARAKPRRGKTPKRAFATSSHRSNAPIKPISQSILSKIVALLTANMACIRPVRIAFRPGRSLASRSARAAERLALSGDPSVLKSLIVSLLDFLYLRSTRYNYSRGVLSLKQDRPLIVGLLRTGTASRDSKNEHVAR